MDILTIPFEKPLLITIKGSLVEITPFKTSEHGNVKFGVNAPRTIDVHREEIYHAIKQKQAIAE